MIVVSGYRRTGTSAMMRALAASLTERAVLAYCDGDEENGNIVYNGYSPNPYPLFEVGGHARDAAFLRGLGQEILIKIFFDCLPDLPVGPHKIVFMERDPREIKRSLERVKKHIKDIGFVGSQPPTPTDIRAFDVYRPYNQEDIDHVLGIMDVRLDVELIRVNFGDLIENPNREFARISRGLRLPMDIDKAASLIEPKYYRSKLSVNSKNRRAGAPANSKDRASQEPARGNI